MRILLCFESHDNDSLVECSKTRRRLSPVEAQNAVHWCIDIHLKCHHRHQRPYVLLPAVHARTDTYPNPFRSNALKSSHRHKTTLHLITLLVLLRALRLRRTPKLLSPILPLLALLPGSLLDFLGKAVADEAVVGLELLEGVGGVVDEGEAGGLAAAELRAEAEHRHRLLVALVQLRQLAAQLVLAHVGAVGVQYVDYHLPPA